MHGRCAILALALAGAFWCGCGDGAEPAGRGGTGGDSLVASGGTVGTGGSIASGGQSGGAPGAGGQVVASGSGGGGSAGHPGATGGSIGAGGQNTAAGGSAGGGAPPSCESLGWSPGNASLCGTSKGGLECAYCDLPAPPKAGAEPDCSSATAFQVAAVLCVTACGRCP